ncbi:hypothetical protein HBI23_246770 [Parastagonospora nodorum]|nr:hypothetical protein HBI23_246770 [Parastagonospora nodorum]KAH5622267.1 hypothetical protein HBI51_247670 [Parastagonospora nodorum]KAH5983586.1 hypothetical protein HBI84_245270 [Parastagonospora nodorum]KAH6134184.1 hypothetical protein HBI68_248660 [Parastagonospora nodorum]KAH6383984.1 hypothetical protein HBI60_251590 [Parastagonospora nodorum]
MTTQRVLLSCCVFLSIAKQGAATTSASQLRRQLLGNPNNPDQPRPFDPQPGQPLLVDPPRSLHQYNNFTVESAVLYASCSSATDEVATSPSVNLSECLKNELGELVFGQGGNAFRTCSHCTMSDTKLNCRCRDGREKDEKQTSIDLAASIDSDAGTTSSGVSLTIDGLLVCYIE